MDRAASTLVQGRLGVDADAAGGDHEFALGVGILGDALAERELAGALALLLPGLAGLRLDGQHVAGTDLAVELEMLLGVEAAAGRGLALDAARRPAGAEPGLTRLRAEMIVGVELRDRLRKSRRHGDAARIRLLGLLDRKSVV